MAGLRALAFFSLILFSPLSFALTGQQLADKCAVGEASENKKQIEQLLDTGSCAGFVGGVVSGIDLIGAMLQQQGAIKTKLFCLPAGVHGQQLVAQVVKHIRAHPSLGKQPAQLVIYQYVRQNYACN